MSDKQFPYDSATDLVLPALQALARFNTNLSLLERDRVIFRSPATYAASTKGKKKVTLISGGGSGHEPVHAGFVGIGMLDASVSGAVFASPSTKQVLAGLTAVQPFSKGTLVIVKNYTGDIINFGLAAERYKAKCLKDKSGDAQIVVVQDDVAVGKKKGGLVGRRGLAGTVLTHKIAGAAAELSANDDSLTLAKVAGIAQAAVNNMVTIGASLDHCNVPGRQFQTNLTGKQMEIGMGIHNEPGVLKLDQIPTIDELVNSKLLPYLLDSNDTDRAYVPFSSEDKVVLLVNNLGGLSNLETQYIAQVALDALNKKHKIKPVRVAVGTFITALNGPGFSLTLLNVSKANKELGDSNIDILDLYDAPAEASGWSVVPFASEEAQKVADEGSWNKAQDVEIKREDSNSKVTVDPKQLKGVLTSGLKSVVKEEHMITKYDTVAGDGDCGETLISGALAISDALDISHSAIGLSSKQKEAATGGEEKQSSDYQIRTNDAVDAIADIAEIVEDSMGGTSGGLYAIYLSSLAQAIHSVASNTPLSIDIISKAAPQALKSLKKYTRASEGDRTLMDALEPFVDVLQKQVKQGVEPKEALAEAVKAAREGAEKTRKMEAKFGRASYVAQEELDQFKSEGGLPDPGAIGLACLLEGFLAGLN